MSKADYFPLLRQDLLEYFIQYPTNYEFSSQAGGEQTVSGPLVGSFSSLWWCPNTRVLISALLSIRGGSLKNFDLWTSLLSVP